MKRRPFIFCLLAALLLPAAILSFQPADKIAAVATKPVAPAPMPVEARPGPPAKVSGNAAGTSAEQAGTVRHFTDTMTAWETAGGLEGDRLEEQLRNLITDENAEAILRALPPRFHGTYVGNLLLARWAARNRDEAIHWLAVQESPSLFEVNAATKNWVVQDSESLERYLDGLPASDWKNLVLESVGRDALTHDDPELAFYLLEAMGDRPAKAPLLANAAQQWAQGDPRAAVEEIDKLADPALRETLILAVASGYALVRPDAAADWLRQSFPDGPILDRGLAGVMQAWTSTGDPAKGAEWVMKLPAGPTRDHTLKELIAAWKQENPETLGNWMSTLSDGSIRAQADAALGSLASLP